MVVLDASALLALTYREDGHEHVTEQSAAGAVISAVNWSEVSQKLTVQSGDAERIGEMLLATGSRIEPFGADEAREPATFLARCPNRVRTVPPTRPVPAVLPAPPFLPGRLVLPG
ncbi:hypothetical protein SAMN04487904_102312 [Actinopolyspora lacussalsi subsp. righensis]|uniref:PIN domain-containing protein n=1 Tax=Actinopolyspora righensis TaxID=995060 RepID=A0A1I6Y900_9ACTN|nr:hypothetical protein SAMN04487904_102312 [Actinopolyspora righensis]